MRLSTLISGGNTTANAIDAMVVGIDATGLFRAAQSGRPAHSKNKTAITHLLVLRQRSPRLATGSSSPGRR